MRSKGQITIPVYARRALDLQSGRRLAIHVQDNTLALIAPPDINTLCETIRKEALAIGTLGTVPIANDGWNARAKERMPEASMLRPPQAAVSHSDR